MLLFFFLLPLPCMHGKNKMAILLLSFALVVSYLQAIATELDLTIVIFNFGP